jgi:hypothetical protein
VTIPPTSAAGCSSEACAPRTQPASHDRIVVRPARVFRNCTLSKRVSDSSRRLNKLTWSSWRVPFSRPSRSRSYSGRRDCPHRLRVARRPGVHTPIRRVQPARSPSPPPATERPSPCRKAGRHFSPERRSNPTGEDPMVFSCCIPSLSSLPLLPFGSAGPRCRGDIGVSARHFVPSFVSSVISFC